MSSFSRGFPPGNLGPGQRPNIVYNFVSAFNGGAGYYDNHGRYVDLGLELDPADELPVRYDFPDAIEMECVIDNGVEVWQDANRERDWFN